MILNAFIWLFGFLIVMTGFYIWNRTNNIDEYRVSFGIAFVVSIFSWLSVVLIVLFTVITYLLIQITESEPVKKLDKWFKGH